MEYRLNNICKKLQNYTDKKSIICLQEVSNDWICRLYMFFKSKKYTFYCINYTDTFGIGIAYPYDNYCFINMESIIIGSRIPVIDNPPISWTSFFSNCIKRLFYEINYKLNLLSYKDYQKKINFLYININEYARNRKNRLLTLLLRRKTDNTTFYVCTYHMPCAYWAPDILTLHTAALNQELKKYTKYPLILAMDANFTPDSFQYKCFTSGNIDEYPIEMKSSYMEINKKEPIYTTGSSYKNTLDYIFYHGKFIPIKVEEPPVLSDTETIPNDKHPSDHLSLYAEFKINIIS